MMFRIGLLIIILSLVIYIVISSLSKRDNDFYESYHKIVNVYTNTSSGTGFFVDNDLVITCTHLIVDIDSPVYIEFIKEQKGTRYITREVEVVSMDRFSDICLLRVNKTDFKPRMVQIAKDKPKSGTSVYTIGSPLNLDSISFCRGEIRDGNWCINGNIINICLTSIPSYQGQSGAPIMSGGKVLALHSSSYGAEKEASMLSGGPSAPSIRFFLENYKARTSPDTKVFQMVQFSDSQLEMSRLSLPNLFQMGITEKILLQDDPPNGFLVSNSDTESIEKGGIITHINNQPVSSDHDHDSVGEILWRLDQCKEVSVTFQTVNEDSVNVLIPVTYSDSKTVISGARKDAITNTNTTSTGVNFTVTTYLSSRPKDRFTGMFIGNIGVYDDNGNYSWSRNFLVDPSDLANTKYDKSKILAIETAFSEAMYPNKTQIPLKRDRNSVVKFDWWWSYSIGFTAIRMTRPKKVLTWNKSNDSAVAVLYRDMYDECPPDYRNLLPIIKDDLPTFDILVQNTSITLVKSINEFRIKQFTENGTVIFQEKEYERGVVKIVKQPKRTINRYILGGQNFEVVQDEGKPYREKTEIEESLPSILLRQEGSRLTRTTLKEHFDLKELLQGCTITLLDAFQQYSFNDVTEVFNLKDFSGRMILLSYDADNDVYYTFAGNPDALINTLRTSYAVCHDNPESRASEWYRKRWFGNKVQFQKIIDGFVARFKKYPERYKNFQYDWNCRKSD